MADSYNSRICKVTAGTGVISTIAGTNVPGFSGDGGLASAAQLNTPTGISIDRSGNLLVPEFSNSRIRYICLSPDKCSDYFSI
ncbi:MAG: hypothetical protein ABIN89_04090 [Chitinophagaceae bacterium]